MEQKNIEPHSSHPLTYAPTNTSDYTSDYYLSTVTLITPAAQWRQRVLPKPMRAACGSSGGSRAWPWPPQQIVRRLDQKRKNVLGSKEGKSLLSDDKISCAPLARLSLSRAALRRAAARTRHATPRHAAAAHTRPRSSRVPTRPSCSPGAVASAFARAATPRHGSQPRVCARARVQRRLQRAIR